MRRPAKHRVLRRNFSLGLGAVIVLAVAAIAYGIFWFAAAAQLRDGVIEWTAARRAEGYTVAYSGLRIGGFPFLFRLTFETLELATPDGAPPWAWAGARAVAEMPPWNPERVSIRLSGGQRLSFPAAAGPATYLGRVENLAAEFVLDQGWPLEGRLEVSGLDLAAAGASDRIAVRAATLRVRRDPDRNADHRTVTIEAWLEAAGISVPSGLSLPLGENIERLTLNAGVMGRIEAGSWPGPLAAWRDAGGTIEVTKLHIVYGPLDLWTTGTLALDGAMQPIGALTAKVQGFFETVDALRQRGLVRLRDAVTAKIVLGVLSRKPEGGGPATLNLALTLQDRKLYAGPVALAELPAIEW